MHELHDPLSRMTAAIERLAVNTETQTKWLHSHMDCATKHDVNAVLQALNAMEKRIMSAISDYTEAVDAKFTDIGASVDELVTGVAGVTADVAGLKDIILKLENNPGPISPEDQALLTSGLAKVAALADRLKGVSSALKELDAATENPPPAPA